MMSADLNTRFNQICGASSILGFFGISAGPLLRGVGQYVPTWAPLTMAERLDMLLKLSIIILITHALFWVGLERLFGWDYATGRTPKGFQAAVMSLSLTLPALTIPLVYQYATARAVVSSNHLSGAVLSVSGGAIAYLVLFGFGTDGRVFPGIREILLVRFRQHQHALWAEILATLAYALILIVLIAAPYRLLVLPASPALVSFAWPALASLVTFFGLSAYILLKYPASLDTSSYWGFLRGIIAGMFTVVSVCTALYA
jgi:hypothetical protein